MKIKDKITTTFKITGVCDIFFISTIAYNKKGQKYLIIVTKYLEYTKYMNRILTR